MSDITIPAEVIGDPEYDGTKETLTFFGSSAILIAKILEGAREKREHIEREERLSALVEVYTKRYCDQTWPLSTLRNALHVFADDVKKIYEVGR